MMGVSKVTTGAVEAPLLLLLTEWLKVALLLMWSGMLRVRAGRPGLARVLAAGRYTQGFGSLERLSASVLGGSGVRERAKGDFLS